MFVLHICTVYPENLDDPEKSQSRQWGILITHVHKVHMYIHAVIIIEQALINEADNGKI